MASPPQTRHAGSERPGHDVCVEPAVPLSCRWCSWPVRAGHAWCVLPLHDGLCQGRAGPDGVHEATASRGQPYPAPVATLSQKQKTCHTPALACWAGQRSRYLARTTTGASPASGRLRLRPPLGLKPVEQERSQTESVLSLRHVRPDRGPLETPRMPREARGDVSGPPRVCNPPVPRLHALPLMRAGGQNQRRCDQGGPADQQHGFPCRLP
jgi:hypothetical protein